MSDDLVKRLRRVSMDLGVPSTTTLDSKVVAEAADRIEELEAANNRLNEQMAAIEEMGTESLNALPDCLMRLAPALVENGELKAKLAKAVEGFEELARLGNGDRYGNSFGNLIAQKYIAELTGDKDE